MKNKQLSILDIVLNADSDTIRQAYEARSKVDGLLIEREEAYKKIYELETQVDEIVGESGVFPFPEPPMPVAGFAPKKAKAKKVISRPSASPAIQESEEKANDDEKEESDSKDTK